MTRPLGRILPLVLLGVALGACHGERRGGGTFGPELDGAPRDPVDAATPDAAVPDTAPPPSACKAAPAPLRATGTVLTLIIQPQFNGDAFLFGEPNAGQAGETVTPLNLRFYVSHIALTRQTQAPLPVDLVTPTGGLEPYGVHLFNAEDPASSVMRVRAPPGQYTGVSFTLGVDDACNSEPPSLHAPPLTDASQMTWPHLAGYLFLRYEAQVTPAGALPNQIHMGGTPKRVLAPTVSASGALTVPDAAEISAHLNFQLDHVFQGATSEIDPSAQSPLAGFPEVLAGDRLREHAPELPLFLLELW
jgi:hypothetical protein